MAPNKARKRLTDLYVVGDFVEFDDPDGGPALRVYVRKLSAVEHEKAITRANASRSRVKALNAEGPEGDVYENIVAEAKELEADELITYLVEDHRNVRYAPLEAELAAEEEWSEDNYLDGLREAWFDGLADAYQDNPEEPEAARVHAELTRFADALDAIVQGELDAFRRDLEQTDEEKLRRRVIDKFLDVRSSIAWINEFRRSEVWLATREEDKKTPYFESRDEVDELAPEVFTRLQAKLRDISVDSVEGKD